MNFTLTPGVYAALNLLSKATRCKVLEAAFAFVICGIRPVNLSKNLLVMFMMVVDSASEGKLTYIPDEADQQKADEPAREAQTEPAPENAREKAADGIAPAQNKQEATPSATERIPAPASKRLKGMKYKNLNIHSKQKRMTHCFVTRS